MSEGIVRLIRLQDLFVVYGNSIVHITGPKGDIMSLGNHGLPHPAAYLPALTRRDHKGRIAVQLLPRIHICPLPLEFLRMSHGEPNPHALIDKKRRAEKDRKNNDNSDTNSNITYPSDTLYSIHMLPLSSRKHHR